MKKLYSNLLPAFVAAGLLLFTGCADDPNPGIRIGGRDQAPTAENQTETSDKVNVAEMSRVVASMFGEKDTQASRAMTDCRVDVVKDSQGSPAIYVVNMDGGGYILISATKKYNPILAYNPTGTFDVEGELPPMVRQWLAGTADHAGGNVEVSADSLEMYRQMWRSYETGGAVTSLLTGGTASRSTGELSSEELVRLREKIAEYEMDWSSKGYEYRCVSSFPDWDASDDQSKYKLLVEPHIYPRYIYNYAELTYNVKRTETRHVSDPVVIETTWNQGYPYNQSFPTLPSGKRAYTGCTTVAAAQIMYHYKYPDTFNWDAMPKNSGNKAVSDLMYALASGAKPDYGEDETGIKLENMCDRMKQLGYHAKYTSYNENKIKSELEVGKPVIISSKFYAHNNDGTIDFIKHAWVMSGGTMTFMTNAYDEWWTFLTASNFAAFERKYLPSSATYSMYHINWGWGGLGDGYYSNIGNAVPQPYPGSPEYKHSNFMDMIVEIYPNK
ncbi:MAG: C10 family peptidase [Bacteroidales bacterium]|nr:C10 family peptidase [Bacteroidales bacterium]